MRIKATINVEYDVNSKDYLHFDSENVERAIQIIELYKLSTAVAEAMPWPSLAVNEAGDVSPTGQILKVKLENE